MCGIFGFTGPLGRPTLEKMGEKLIHRGPDDKGYYVGENVGLGIRRLAIVDIETGQQPIANEDRTIITVCNGEIYNHKKLRKELIDKAHVFQSDHSDIETILHLYEEYGADWPNKANGMFGAAIWDDKKQQLSLYRDRIGKKPLYYALVGGQIVFASEIKAVLSHPQISRTIDYNALYSYFSNKNVSAPQTCFKHIKELEPGHALTWRKGSINIQPFWQVSFTEKLLDITEDEIASQLFALYVDAVRLRLDCDVPYGAYLSGGIDSSSVVAIMTKLESKPVKTFCLGYEDKNGPQFAGKEQDLFFARKMSEILGTEHYELVIDSNHFLKYIPNIIRSFDSPFSGTISTYFLSQLIKQHVKVALSGDGADELFGSYLSHRLAHPIKFFVQQEFSEQSSYELLSPLQKKGLEPFDSEEQFNFLKKIASPSLHIWRQRLSVFSDSEKRQLLTPEYLSLMDIQEMNDNIYQKIESTLSASDQLDQNLEIDQRELLPNQVLPFVDRLSMAHSIEVRCPFLDYRIIEFANSVPAEMKIKGRIVKHIHKKAVSDILPQKILQRPKEGFVQPIYTWMHAALKKEIMKELERLPFDLMNKNYCSEITAKFNNGDPSMNAKVWNLYCFSVWYNQNT